MSEQHPSIFCHGFRMQNLPTSNAANLPSTCDEELADEADEPDDLPNNYYYQTDFCRVSLSDGEFSKHSVYDQPAQKESLLTRALLTSPHLGPVDRPAPHLERGMSNSSVWSNTSGASTADLTSDAGMTSPSRSNTPSPPPPMYLAGIAGVLHHGGDKHAVAFKEPKRVVADKDDVVEGLGRKRIITFACASRQLSPRGSEDSATAKPEDFKKQNVESAAPKKNSALTFVCAQRGDDSQKPSMRPMRSPPPVPKHIDFALDRPKHIDFALDRPALLRVAAPTNDIETPVARKPVGFLKVPLPERQLYDSESAADSWTNLPIDKTRLLRVDDLLRKERDIRKLSEEAEAEALQEEGLDDEEEEGDDTLVDDDDDDAEGQDDDDEDDYQDDDEDEDEDEDGDDEGRYGGDSGDETDDEDGFAEDDSDDEGFFGVHPPMAIPVRPICDRTISESSYKFGTSPRHIRAATPELPDSTDFVCGTFDEDKPLEDAYLSALEIRKRSKHKATPQDIDPSFPQSEPEDSDRDELEPRKITRINRDDSSSDGNHSRGRKVRAGIVKDQSPPRGRIRSPAPVRRTAMAHSPAPTRRARSRSVHASPPPISRRGSRALSPAPPRRRTQFHTGNNIVRARSLPRNSGIARRGGRSSRVHSAAGSPQKATRPMVISRGAIDIVKGLEKKRERRRARLGRKDKDCLGKAGEGVEKMRELGLEICGKGRSRPIWVISA